MKRAKLLLALIAMATLGGGVYASKAKRTGQFVYTRETPTTRICTVTVPEATFTTTEGDPFTTTFATLIINAPCPTIHTIYVGL